MYALLIAPSSLLPSVVSMRSTTYPEMIQMGYQQLRTGTQKELQDVESEMLQEFCADLEMNSND